jgi:hypothetical protein
MMGGSAIPFPKGLSLPEVPKLYGKETLYAETPTQMP